MTVGELYDVLFGGYNLVQKALVIVALVVFVALAVKAPFKGREAAQNSLATFMKILLLIVGLIYSLYRALRKALKTLISYPRYSPLKERHDMIKHGIVIVGAGFVDASKVPIFLARFSTS